MNELETTLTMDTILDSDNLVDSLSNNDLDSISSVVRDGYDLDKESRATWECKVSDWTELALQVAEKKMFPWPNAANVKYPLVTVASLQFNARAYPALISGTKPIRGRVLGKDPDGSKLERAIRISKHMSYQILEQMDDWEEEMDRLLIALPIVGCVFKKTYYDAILQRNVSEVVFPKELVVNYWTKNLDESERITHVLKYSENEVFEKVSGGIFAKTDYTKAPLEEEEENEEGTNKALGIKDPEKEDETSPFMFLEQCCYLDLDGDGYKEPYIVTVDYGSGKIARIVARFEEDSIKYNDKNEIYKISPFTFYTKFSFIPSPDGSFYDVGFGVILGPINETINTLINQLLDAGTLSNMQAGFMSKGIRIKGGNTTFTPGEWKFVNSFGDDLRKGLLPLPVREPSQVLFSLLGMMVTAGEKLSSVSEVMTGEIPGQNTKATVALAAIEQGMKVFNAIYKRIHRSLTKEYKKLFKLNSMFLDEQEYFTVLDVGQEQGSNVGRADYALQDIDVIPTSDPNVATEQQKLAKLQVLEGLLQMGTINPQEYTRRVLEATDQPNIKALLDMPPPQPSLDEKKFEDDSARAWKEIEIQELNSATKRLLEIAQAEAAEPGSQMAQYQAELEYINKAVVANQKYQQAEMIHQQKMRHAEEQQMSKMQATQPTAGGGNGSGEYQ